MLRKLENEEFRAGGEATLDRVPMAPARLKGWFGPIIPVWLYPHTSAKTPGGSVKTRRKSLSDNKVYLQITQLIMNEECGIRNEVFGMRHEVKGVGNYA
jgi:hypothetical protein